MLKTALIATFSCSTGVAEKADSTCAVKTSSSRDREILVRYKGRNFTVIVMRCPGRM